MCVPQNPCKLRRPQHFSSSGIHLCSLPTVIASDRAQLERLFERVLGSSSSNEELEVASHKNKDAYVALWLYRIALDPDEGTAYTKFMRKSGIGRKYAVFYVKQVPSNLSFLPSPHLLSVRHCPDSCTPCFHAHSATISTSLTSDIYTSLTSRTYAAMMTSEGKAL